MHFKYRGPTVCVGHKGAKSNSGLLNVAGKRPVHGKAPTSVWHRYLLKNSQ